MSIISKIKGWISMFFKQRAKEDFGVETLVSASMEDMLSKCMQIYQGNPEWLDEEGGIKTINFAKAVCSETARLAMLGTKISITGGERAKWLQQQIDNVYYKLRDWVEYGCAAGTVILKPNGSSIDLVMPGNFAITDQSNGKIQGIVFYNRETSEDGKRFYTRLEYHRFVGDMYVITNRCYVADKENDKGRPIDITKTPWAGLAEEVQAKNINSPLFGVLRMPHANNIDVDSPMGLPIFSDAIEELKDLDIAYSRNSEEVYDSRRTVLLDSDRLLDSGQRVNNTAAGFEQARDSMKLPKYVKAVYGNGRENIYEEINPKLNTDERLKGINAILSQIGYKIGFSNGYFVFNESGGLQTATEVESDDRRTLQFIKDVRDKLEECLGELIYALNAFADLYDLAPLGKYEVVYDFGDITYNREEDRKRWWGYVVAGKVPAWKYFEKFEGMTEEDAKKMIAEAAPQEKSLFKSEE